MHTHIDHLSPFGEQSSDHHIAPNLILTYLLSRTIVSANDYDLRVNCVAYRYDMFLLVRGVDISRVRRDENKLLCRRRFEGH